MKNATTNNTNEAEIGSAVVLVVDDEPSICWGFERMLRADGHEVFSASSAEEGLQIAQEKQPDLVLLDVRLPQEDGITALPKFIQTTGNASVVVMTAFGDLETAVAAVNNGASDYLTKPFSLEAAARICRVSIQASRSHVPKTPSSIGSDDAKIVGSSPAIQHAFRQIALVAKSDLSVLITGETGTGKELVAAAIHQYSTRCDQPYLPIAPVALNSELIESELFGHIKGAFTGAVDDRIGLFEQAEGGTILLDEIGDLPLSVQAKLLRVLEQREYCRVGEIAPRKCDVRILAATNCDLNLAIQDQHFREDLYYRLNGLHIHLPPLRDRTEDIAELCQYFLDRLNYESSNTLSESIIASLTERPWHGNIRELKNAIEHAAVVARGRPISVEDLPCPQPGSTATHSPKEALTKAIVAWAAARMKDGDDSQLHSRILGEIEPVLIQFALEETDGNRVNAAKLLGLHRGTLREKLRQYGLVWDTK